MSQALHKYLNAIDRLTAKMKISKTPVPGFIMGLSGTDSLVAFHMIYAAAENLGIEDKVTGIHFARSERTKKTWFEEKIIPEMQSVFHKAHITTQNSFAGNIDQYRWAELHLRAVKENQWVVGTINATENELGTYSILADTASIQPIRGFWKSEILEICDAFSLYDEAIERAKTPDCFCGREEIAAANPLLIDNLLRYKVIDNSIYPPDLVAEVTAYINEKKSTNDFKKRIPYLI